MLPVLVNTGTGATEDTGALTNARLTAQINMLTANVFIVC